MLSDIEIAQRATLQPIVELARDRLQIPESQLEPYGRYKAKLSLAHIAGLAGRPDGKLILMSAISPKLCIMIASVFFCRTSPP